MSEDSRSADLMAHTPPDHDPELRERPKVLAQGWRGELSGLPAAVALVHAPKNPDDN